MSDSRIDELWHQAYEDDYLRLDPKHRNDLANGWLKTLSMRPHIRFARLIERELQP